MTDISLFNCYTILRINPRAPYDEVKAAFRALSKISHPDVSPDASEEEQVRLNHAYEVLTDPVLRELHDRFWKVSEPRKRKQHTPVKNKGTARSTVRRTAARTSPTSYDLVLARVRKEVQEKENEIKASSQNRNEEYVSSFTALFRKKRFIFIAKAVFSCAIMGGSIFFPLFFILSLLLAAILLIPDIRVDIEYDSVFVFSPAWKKRIERAAKLKAGFSIEKELAGLDRFGKILKIMREEVIRGSRLSDPEVAVAGRLSLALFFVGYTPVSYDPRTRTIRLSIGTDMVLVRYRHRKGAPTNVAYVKKMAEFMSEADAISGFIFSSPGLSGKALALAKKHNISSYTLKEMNEWMRSVYGSGHSGPAGSILAALDALAGFIRELAVRKYRSI